MPRASATGRPGTPVISDHLHAAIRSVWTAAMIDEFEVTRPSGDWVTDPTTFETVPAPPTEIYAGPGIGQPWSGLNNRATVIAGETRTANRYVVAIEWDADQVLVDDHVQAITTSDPLLVDRRLVVRDAIYDSMLVRRVLVCEDDSGIAQEGES